MENSLNLFISAELQQTIINQKSVLVMQPLLSKNPHKSLSYKVDDLRIMLYQEFTFQIRGDKLQFISPLSFIY